MRLLIILRGLPGAGKSTKAIALAKATVMDTAVWSADAWFQGVGGYRFNPRELGQAHAWCQTMVIGSMGSGIPIVIVDNTHVCRWEFSVTLAAAAAVGYRVQVDSLYDAGLTDAELAARCQHGVSVEAIAAMRRRWEP